MDLKKLQTQGNNKSKYFKKVAEAIVMNEVTNTDDDNKKVIAMFTARDMAMGAALKRNEYLLTGSVIGIVGTVLTFKLVSEIKKRRNMKKEDTERVLENAVISKPTAAKLKLVLKEINEHEKDAMN